jgi:hypothetical protein
MSKRKSGTGAGIRNMALDSTDMNGKQVFDDQEWMQHGGMKSKLGFG